MENKPLLPSPPFIIIPELALGASILVSTFHYGRSVGSQGSVLLDNGLVTELNETLFERQRLSYFSIDPTPYTGKFKITKTIDSILGEKASSTIAVKDVENILRFDYPKDLGFPI